mmetsp:Transcript_51981/g.151022  ORF Transcript_51981/g.151022 Transcript_51981/m.151022 type:complete len:210 (-) Transcript_51981:625-1254(-)
MAAELRPYLTPRPPAQRLGLPLNRPRTTRRQLPRMQQRWLKQPLLTQRPTLQGFARIGWPAFPFSAGICSASSACGVRMLTCGRDCSVPSPHALDRLPPMMTRSSVSLARSRQSSRLQRAFGTSSRSVCQWSGSTPAGYVMMSSWCSARMMLDVLTLLPALAGLVLPWAHQVQKPQFQDGSACLWLWSWTTSARPSMSVPFSAVRSACV